MGAVGVLEDCLILTMRRKGRVAPLTAEMCDFLEGLPPDHPRKLACATVAGVTVATCPLVRLSAGGVLFIYGSLATATIFLTYTALFPLASFQYLLGACPNVRFAFDDGAFLWPIN